MSLSSGTKLGVYEVISPLGAGGMGEVYRARDTKLQRDVALKILPEAMARDAQRMARFEREARTLASLNHPNIAAIYGLEESNGIRALVMELVEGETLAERLRRTQPLTRPASRDTLSPQTGRGEELNDLTPSPQGRGWSCSTGPGEGSRGSTLAVDEALPIAKQIAEALEYAHERGVIHRDLKPANVKITPEGKVKVLDFGLAKVLTGQDSSVTMDPANSPTLSTMATQAGMILGTAAYMSPEQAKGQRVDRRADIWAFGCVLYEMLAGRKPFEGETISDMLAAVIRADPDWTAIPETTPPSIQKLIRRCLQKDQRQRLQAIGDARITIEETLSGVGAALVPALAETAPGRPQGSPRRVLPWAVAAGLMLLLGIAAGWWARSRRSPSTPNWSAQMLGGPSVAMGPRISPDGHTLAFQAMVNGLTQVAVMDTESGDWTVLTKDRTRGYVTELNWSNDGSRIYFDREFAVPGGIYTVSRFGGDERLVLNDAMGPEVLADGSLLVVMLNKERDYQLYHFWPDTGRTETLDAILTSIDLCPPVRAFRDGKDAVFFGRTKEQARSAPAPHLYILNLASGKTRRLMPGLDIPPLLGVQLFPLAVSSDDQSVLIDLKAGDLHRITAISRNGSGSLRTLLTLTSRVWFMDVGKDGDLYIDQANRSMEALRFSTSGGTGASLAATGNPSSEMVLQLSDGRVVLGSMVAGRSRLLVTKPGGEAAPFIQTNEETSPPICLVGQDTIAFQLGSPGHSVIALASIADGRIVKRLSGISAGDLNDLSASPDGKTLYYSDSRTVWAVPAAGGQSRRIGPGNNFALDPNGKDLVVQAIGKQGVQLFRVPAAGGKEQPIPLQGPLRVAPIELNPNAVAKDGRVLLSFASPDKWFYGAAILDPRSGKLTKIPLDFSGDLLSPGWLPDGRVLSSAWPLKVTLWRFRPVNGKQ